MHIENPAPLYVYSFDEFKSAKSKVEPVELRFENGTVKVDELFSFKYGRLRSSSFRYGIAEWNKDKKTYEHHFHLSTTDLGKPLFVVTDEPILGAA